MGEVIAEALGVCSKLLNRCFAEWKEMLWYIQCTSVSQNEKEQLKPNGVTVES